MAEDKTASAKIKGAVGCVNRCGEHVTAIPLPYYGLRYGCRCGEKFWTEKGYRGHYALDHILDLD